MRIRRNITNDIMLDRERLLTTKVRCINCTTIVKDYLRIDPLLKRCNTITHCIDFFTDLPCTIRYAIIVHILVVIEPVKILYDHSLY